MSKKESITDIEKKESIKLTETIPNSDEFDLGVLKIDIESQEKEIRELRNQELIKKANFQKTEETERLEAESFQDFNEAFQEIMEFIFRFINNPLKKLGMTPFGKEFIEKFRDKLFDMLPKDSVDKFKETMSVGGKTKTGIRLMRVFRFLTFMTNELFIRIDEFKEIKKLQNVDKEAE